jgi:hypothetical protein
MDGFIYRSTVEEISLVRLWEEDQLLNQEGGGGFVGLLIATDLVQFNWLRSKLRTIYKQQAKYKIS